jgi:hypothetical protein
MFWWNYQKVWFHKKNVDKPCVIWDNQTIWFYQKSIMNLITYILGINIYRDRSKRLFGLSQFRYID